MLSGTPHEEQVRVKVIFIFQKIKIQFLLILPKNTENNTKIYRNNTKITKLYRK